jgi:L-ascorbate metabolism protein UlaG (beta-lactamase superfamily)
MDIQFHGANCITVGTKHARITVDDNLSELGGKSVLRQGDIALYTGSHGDPTQEPKLLIDQPGEYEVTGVSVFGIAARSHLDEEKQMNATMYKVMADDLTILFAGHIYPDLSDAQLEAIGMVDVLCIPVGGNGYTLDAIGALKLVKKIEPKLVIPTHYADDKLQFPVPQQELGEALKVLAMEPKETVAKLRLKSAELTDVTQLIVLEKS